MQNSHFYRQNLGPCFKKPFKLDRVSFSTPENRIVKTLCFEHASQNASGFRISLYSIVHEWIFGMRVTSMQPKALSKTKEYKRMRFSSNLAALCFEKFNACFGARVFDFKFEREELGP